MARSNAAGLYVPPTAVEQLGKLLKYVSRLPEIIEQSKKLPLGLTAFEILEPFAAQIGISYDELSDIFYALENLRITSEDFGSFSDALDRIAAAVNPDLAKNLEANKAAILDAFEKYDFDNPVSITIKAQKLTYFHERILRDSEVITDVRPVFDSSGRNVLEAVISHVLVVTATTVGRNERLHFAMDAGDVLKLRRACDRAIEKAKTIKSTLENSDLKWKIQVLRGQDNGVS
jgi:hypothetical protein